MHRTEVEVVQKRTCPLVGGAFIDSLPMGTVFCNEFGNLWVRVSGERRAMYLDGTGTITAPNAHWGEQPLHVVTKLRAEY